MSNKLPSEYQELEYIENIDDSYINIGFSPTDNTKIEISIFCRSETNTNMSLIGSRTTR